MGLPYWTVAGCAALATIAMAGTATAQRAAAKPQSSQPAGAFEVGKAGSWGIYTSGEGKTKLCYVLSQPNARLPKNLNRDPAYVFIANRPADGAKHEVSVITGYPLKTGSVATAAVGSASFEMLARDTNAWLKNPAEETRFIGELRRLAGSRTALLTIKGTSARGNETTDQYKLDGFAQAFDRAQKECAGKPAS